MPLQLVVARNGPVDFDLFYSDFSAPQYGDKPLMVGENGSLPKDLVGQEQQWSYLLGLLAKVQFYSYPKLKAYDYFERGLNPAINWVLDGTTADAGGIAAMKILGASPSFSPMVNGSVVGP